MSLHRRLHRRLHRLEAAQDARRTWPLAWPSVEAAAAAGLPAGAGFIVAAPPMPFADWVQAARAQQAALLKDARHEA